MPDTPIDLLERDQKLEAFTKIVTGKGAPNVISVEAGFGVGKTTFAELWKQQLEGEHRHVVMLNAWAAEHGIDPLATLLAGMLNALPEEQRANVETRKKLGGLALSLLKSGYRIGGKAILKDGFTEANEIIGGGLEKAVGWLSSISSFADPAHEEAPAKETSGEATNEDTSSSSSGSFGKESASLLTGELESLIFKKESQQKAIQKMRELLTGSEDGQVIVFIDELDRCRPDAALSMLEAMKHVFDHEGFMFILMINAVRLENIATRTYGDAVQGEPYLAKFIGLRLQLDAGNIANLLRSRAGEIKGIPYVPFNNPKLPFEELVDQIASSSVLQKFSARSVERAINAVKITLLLYPEQPVLLDLLILMALQDAQSNERIANWRHIYNQTATKSPGLSMHNNFINYQTFRDAHAESRNHNVGHFLQLYLNTKNVLSPSNWIRRVSDKPISHLDRELQILTEHHARLLNAAHQLTAE